MHASSSTSTAPSSPVSKAMVQIGGEVTATPSAHVKPQRRRWQPFKRLLWRNKDKQPNKQQQPTPISSAPLDASRTGDDDDDDDDKSWNSSPSSPSKQQQQQQQRQQPPMAVDQEMPRRQSNPNPRKQHSRRPNSPLTGDTTSTKSFADFEVEASNSIMMRHDGYQTTSTTSRRSVTSGGGARSSVEQAWLKKASCKMQSIPKGKRSSKNGINRSSADDSAETNHPSPPHVTQLVLREGSPGGVSKNGLQVVSMAMRMKTASNNSPTEAAVEAAVAVADIVDESQQQQQVDSSALEHQYSSSRLLVQDADEQQQVLSVMLKKQHHREHHRDFLLDEQDTNEIMSVAQQDENGPLDVDSFIPKHKVFPTPPLSSQKHEPKCSKNKLVMIPVRNYAKEVLVDSEKSAHVFGELTCLKSVALDNKAPNIIAGVSNPPAVKQRGSAISSSNQHRRELGLTQSSSPQLSSKTTTTTNDRNINITPVKTKATTTTTTLVSPSSPMSAEAAASMVAPSRPTWEGSEGASPIASPLHTKTSSPVAPVIINRSHANEVESMDAPADEHVECVKEEHARVRSISRDDLQEVVEAVMERGRGRGGKAKPDTIKKRVEPGLLGHHDDDDDYENASEYPTTDSGGTFRIHCIEVSSSGREIEVAELAHFYDDRLGRLVELTEGNHHITETIHAEEVSLDASASENSEQSDADPFKSLEEEEAGRPPDIIAGPPLIAAAAAAATTERTQPPPSPTTPLHTPRTMTMAAVSQESPKSITKIAPTNLANPVALITNRSNKWQKNKKSKSKSKTGSWPVSPIKMAKSRSWPAPPSPNLGIEVDIKTSQQTVAPITPQPSDEEEESPRKVAPKSVKQSRRALLKAKQAKATGKQAKDTSSSPKEAAPPAQTTVRRAGLNEHSTIQGTFLTTSQDQQPPTKKPVISDPNQASPTTSCTSDLAGPDAEDLQLTRETSDLSGSMGVDSRHLEIQSDLPEHEMEIVLDKGGEVAKVSSVDDIDDDTDYIDDRDERIERKYSEESSDNDDTSQEVDDSAYSDSDYDESDYTSMTGDSDTESPTYVTSSLLMHGIRLAETIVGSSLHHREYSETEEEDEDEEEEGEEATLLAKSESESVTSHGSLNDDSTNRSSYSFSSHSSDGSATGTACSSSR